MEFDTKVKLAVYRHFADVGTGPTPEQVGDRVGASIDLVLEAYQRLRVQRVLVVEEDGSTIRMASPFSGVPTQHVVESKGVTYHANCAWDALGIAASLQRPAKVRSRCEQSSEPLHLEVSVGGPEPCDWVFHSVVPAAHWWDDIVFT